MALAQVLKTEKLERGKISEHSENDRHLWESKENGTGYAWLSSRTIMDIPRDARKEGNNKNTQLPGL